jgi:hypothetical protein
MGHFSFLLAYLRPKKQRSSFPGRVSQPPASTYSELSPITLHSLLTLLWYKLHQH